MRIWLLTKKGCILSFSIVMLAIGLLLAGNNDAVLVSTIKKDLPIYYVKRPENEKIISISFDAAWGNEDTNELIGILKKYDIKTTFFVVGGWVDKYPESVKAISDDGHEIMNHSNTHPHMTKLSTEKIKEEVEKCGEKIEKITGVKPFLFRPPYGSYNNRVIQALRELNYLTIQWNVDSLDWKDLLPGEIYERVINKIKPGAIVLFHNAAKHTPEALPGILEKLQSDGYKIVPISELIFRNNFVVDSTGGQIPN